MRNTNLHRNSFKSLKKRLNNRWRCVVGVTHGSHFITVESANRQDGGVGPHSQSPWWESLCHVLWECIKSNANCCIVAKNGLRVIMQISAPLLGSPDRMKHNYYLKSPVLKFPTCFLWIILTSSKVPVLTQSPGYGSEVFAVKYHQNDSEN
jgi:hypothetical protein